MISIDDYRHSYAGHLRDLSVGGAFIEPHADNDPQIGQELMLTIPFSLKHDHIIIKAKVAWIKPRGIGVRFIKHTDDRKMYR
jgi:Tfp pilus assembly protein PilZ